MARKPRFTLSGVPQHIIQRGHNREPCFYAESDYSRYLDNLQEAAKKNQVVIHAYVLMTNHVHLLATPGQPYSVTHMMQDHGRKFVRYINRTYQRSGSLWESRYKASLIDSEAYLLTCMRYIELNPVRANMVVHPGEYRWSSYAHNATGRENPLIEPHPVYKRLGKSADQRQYAYRELFHSSIDTDQIHQIRDALNQELVLGREDFKQKIEQMTKRQVWAGQAGRPRLAETSPIYYVL